MKSFKYTINGNVYKVHILNHQGRCQISAARCNPAG